MVRRRIPALSAAILLLVTLAAPASAQEAGRDTTLHGPPAVAEDSRVLVTLLSSSESPPGAPKLPLSMIQRLVSEDHIQNFSVEANRARTEFSLDLLFEDAEGFRSWYESDSAQQIIETLNERDDLTRLSMRVRRL